MFQRAMERMGAFRRERRKRGTRRRPDGVRLHPEVLEDRRLLCTVSTDCIIQSGADIDITGTSGSDRITLYNGDGGLLVGFRDGTTGTTNEHGPYYSSSSITINAGDGDDDVSTATNVSQSVTINGGSGRDYLAGGGQDDIINGEDGDDNIHGAGGNDTLDGGAGDDEIRGREGNDTINGGDDNDDISGGSGEDLINGDNGVATAGGNDRIAGGNGNDIIRGNGGADNINGEVGSDIVLGEDGNDTVMGSQGNDILIGGNGGDNHQGDGGDDVLAGGDTTLTDTQLESIRTELNSSNDVTTKHTNIQAILNSSLSEDNAIDGHTGHIGADLVVAHPSDRNYSITGDDTLTIL